jgi:hypothetical protein
MTLSEIRTNYGIDLSREIEKRVAQAVEWSHGAEESS